MAPRTARYQALVNLSISREDEPAGPLGRQADLVYRGQFVDLTSAQVERLQGKIRLASEADQPMPRLTARDLSGRRFPDQRMQEGLAPGSPLPRDTVTLRQPPTEVPRAQFPEGDQPEAHPPVMMNQGPENNPAPDAPPDPYATQDAKR